MSTDIAHHKIQHHLQCEGWFLPAHMNATAYVTFVFVVNPNLQVCLQLEFFLTSFSSAADCGLQRTFLKDFAVLDKAS